MSAIAELTALYDTYVQKLEQVRKKASATAGLLGFGEDPRDHSCHDEFYDGVRTWVETFLISSPEQSEIVAATQWLLKMAHQHRGEPTYWYLYAIHAHAEALINLLDPQSCASLRTFYDDAYPVVDRMPVQKKIYKQLACNSADKNDRSIWNRRFWKK